MSNARRKLLEKLSLNARPHHHQSTHDTYRHSEPISDVGKLPIYEPSPENGEDDKDRSVRGVNAAERMGDRLEDRNDPIQCQKNKSKTANPDDPMFSQPKPYEISTPHFEQTGEKEKSK